MEWAEAALRAELLDRGVSAATLDDVALRRAQIAQSKPPLVRDTVVGYGILGRIGAAFLAAGAAGIVNAVLGYRAAVIAVLIVVAGYVAVLFRRVSRQFATPVGGWGAALMIWQCIEAAIVFLAVLALSVSSFLSAA